MLMLLRKVEILNGDLDITFLVFFHCLPAAHHILQSQVTQIGIDFSQSLQGFASKVYDLTTDLEEEINFIHVKLYWRVLKLFCCTYL